MWFRKEEDDGVWRRCWFGYGVHVGFPRLGRKENGCVSRMGHIKPTHQAGRSWLLWESPELHCRDERAQRGRSHVPPGAAAWPVPSLGWILHLLHRLRQMFLGKMSPGGRTSLVCPWGNRKTPGQVLGCLVWGKKGPWRLWLEAIHEAARSRRVQSLPCTDKWFPYSF